MKSAILVAIAGTALLAGCQAESTTPTPPAANTANNAAPTGGGPNKSSAGQMGMGVEPAPAGADTSLKGGMK